MTDPSTNHIPTLTHRGGCVLPRARTATNTKGYPPEYYHYTNRRCLEGILRSRAIVPDVDPYDHAVHGELALVWVSSIKPWDPICRATLELDPVGWFYLPPEKVPGGPYAAARIHVATSMTKPWSELLTNNGVSSATIFKLAQTGYDSGSDPEQWRACIGPISNCFWLSVELWNGTDWEALDTHGDFFSIGDLDTFMSRHAIREKGEV